MATAVTGPTPAPAPGPGPGHALVLSGGAAGLLDAPADHVSQLRAVLRAPALVVAADAGLLVADRLGVRVDVLVGDLDSLPAHTVTAAEAAGVEVSRHPPDKDATDLDLALDAVSAAGFATATVVSGPGDRLDHLAAELALLGAARLAHLGLDAWVGRAHVLVVHGPGTAAVPGPPDGLVTLLAVGAAAHGIRTEGMRFALHRETLRPGETRGVSNQLVGAGTVHVEEGSLLVIVPHALA